MKKLLLSGLFLLLFGIFATPTFAHVTVKPSEVGVGERLNFVVSVPTEELAPTVQVRLVLPDGLQSVRPNTKAGWNIRLVKTGEGEEARVTEIIWSGSSIPADQKDEFIFSAQVPAQETTLIWKAYQSYQDNEVVAWDADPKEVEKQAPPEDGADHHSALKPYSETKVINDLKPSAAPLEGEVNGDSNQNLPLIISGVALLLAALSLGLQFNRKSSPKTR